MKTCRYFIIAVLAAGLLPAGLAAQEIGPDGYPVFDESKVNVEQPKVEQPKPELTRDNDAAPSDGETTLPPTEKQKAQIQKGADAAAEETFVRIGRQAAKSLPANATDLEKAQAVLRELDKEKDLVANTNQAGRVRELTALSPSAYTCGDWRAKLKRAFVAAGIPNQNMGSAEGASASYEEGVVDSGTEAAHALFDPNHGHTAILVKCNGKFYMFDPWQYGADRSSMGIGSIQGVGNSKYNGMPLDRWYAVQKANGRPLLGMDETDLDKSPLFVGEVQNARKQFLAWVSAGKIKLGENVDSKQVLERIAKIMRTKLLDSGGMDVRDVLKALASAKLITVLDPSLLGIQAFTADGTWSGVDSRQGRFSGTLDLQQSGNRVSGTFRCSGGDVNVHGTVSQTQMVLICEFNDAKVIDHFMGDMRLSSQITGVTAKLEMEIGKDFNQLSGKLGPWNVVHHEEDGKVVVTKKSSNGSDSSNPKRDFSMTRTKAAEEKPKEKEVETPTRTYGPSEPLLER